MIDLKDGYELIEVGRVEDLRVGDVVDDFVLTAYKDAIYNWECQGIGGMSSHLVSTKYFQGYLSCAKQLGQKVVHRKKHPAEPMRLYSVEAFSRISGTYLELPPDADRRKFECVEVLPGFRVEVLREGDEVVRNAKLYESAATESGCHDLHIFRHKPFAAYVVEKGE